MLAAFALVLLIALSSYDPYDPGFTRTGEPGQVGNLIGPLGAHIADMMLLAFGWPAYLFPFVIAFSAWVGLKRKSGEPSQGSSTIALRTVGVAIVLATSCGLATLHYEGGGLPSDASAGGVLGNLVGNGLESVLALLGATLVMLALWFAGVQLYTGVSWPRVMDFIGHWVLAGASWVRSRMASSHDQAVGRESRAARETAVREVQKKAATRTPPRIEMAAPAVPEASVRVEKER